MDLKFSNTLTVLKDGISWSLDPCSSYRPNANFNEISAFET